jgi:hypothetical protein
VDSVYVRMTTELFIKYFCSIKLCCLWRFDEKLFVLEYCFIFIVLGPNTSTPGSKIWIHRCDKGSPGGRSHFLIQFNHTIKTDPTRRFWYIILSIFKDIQHQFSWVCVLILFYIYCFRAGHLYTCQQNRDAQMSQRLYWMQGPQRLPWTMM